MKNKSKKNSASKQPPRGIVEGLLFAGEIDENDFRVNHDAKPCSGSNVEWLIFAGEIDEK